MAAEIKNLKDLKNTEYSLKKVFKEAEDLVSQKGVLCINNKTEFKNLMAQLTSNSKFLNETGEINAQYVMKNKGASIQIIEHIRTLL